MQKIRGKVAGVVELLDADPVRLETLGGLDRARDGALDAPLDLRELVDEEVRGRAGTHADPRVVDDVLDRFAGDRLLEGILVHRRASRGRGPRS